MAFIYLRNVMRWMGFGGTSQYTGEQITTPSSGVRDVPVNVNEDVALALSTVWGAARILCETIATMPMMVGKRVKGEILPDENHDLYRLLCMAPNSAMTAIDFWEAVMLNLVLRGNGYGLIMRNSIGMPVALYPLASSQMQPFRTSDGVMHYLYTVDGKQHLYAAEDILHFKIFGNGYVGLSPIAYGAMSMGVGSAADKYAGTFFSRGGKPGGVLTIDRVLTPKQREEIRANFKEIHEGADSAHRLFVLEAGMSYQQVQVNPDDLQMIETRRFSVQDIARFFGVPSFLLNESQGSTTWGTGLEQQMLGFYTLTLRPYALRIAATCKQKLVLPGDQRKVEIYYDFDELMAVDTKAKADYYSKLATAGIMSRNEVRIRLGLEKSPEKNADALTVQTALVPLGKLGEQPPKPAPQPGAPDETGTKNPDDSAE